MKFLLLYIGIGFIYATWFFFIHNIRTGLHVWGKWQHWSIAAIRFLWNVVAYPPFNSLVKIPEN